jgi:phage shock protein PspC (stress-responsive transcriptional regulator)
MNKTVTININGILFHIEEDAYENLGRYLASIRSYFSATEGGTDIMSDIEARIAELLQERLGANKQVLVMDDVEYVKTIMGDPREFGEGQPAGKEESQADQNTPYEKIRKRLFRNPDEKAVGGVCSGLAAYFDIDTVWVRLVMFLLIFFGGISLWLYIIMWIIIPEAKTTAEKFAMRGQSANINNIFRSFKEEAEDVKNRFNKYGSELNRSYGDAVRSNAGDALRTIFNILARLIGLFLVLFGGACLMAFVASLLGLSVMGSNSDVKTWVSVVFASHSHYIMAVISFIIVVGIPVFMLLYAGIKMLFRIRYSNRWMNMSLGFIWLFGILMSFYIAVVTIKQFSEHTGLKETFPVKMNGDTLRIKLNPATSVLAPYGFENADEIDSGHNGFNYRFGRSGRHVSVIGMPLLNVVESTGDSAELLINYSSQGGTKKEANENAKAVRYAFRQNNSDLVFDELFTVKEDVKWRAPEVNMKLKLPVGTVVYFDHSIKPLLNDVENTTNTWDGDMVGRRWKMTEKGLSCLDCDNLHNIGDEHEWDHHPRNIKHNVRINDHGINVNGEDAEIRINKSGILIETDRESVTVDSQGVTTKKKR